MSFLLSTDPLPLSAGFSTLVVKPVTRKQSEIGGRRSYLPIAGFPTEIKGGGGLANKVKHPSDHRIKVSFIQSAIRRPTHWPLPGGSVRRFCSIRTIRVHDIMRNDRCNDESSIMDLTSFSQSRLQNDAFLWGCLYNGGLIDMEAEEWVTMCPPAV